MLHRRLPLAALALALAATPPAAAQTYRDHYLAGTAAAAAGQPDEAYRRFTLAAEGARADGDPDAESRARRVLAQVEYNRGARLLRYGRAEEALARFEAGVAQDADNARNHVGRAQALVGLGRQDEAVGAFRAGATAARRRGDSTLVRLADSTLRAVFTVPARRFLEVPSPTRAGAEIALERLDAHDAVAGPDAASRYLRGRVFLVFNQPVDALAAADDGLARYRGDRAGAAGLQLVRGEALLRMNRGAEARPAFEAALYGPFRARAEARVRELVGR